MQTGQITGGMIASICTRCGAPYAQAGPNGHCPSCLLNLALADEPEPAEKNSGVAPGPGEQRAECFGDYELIEEISRGAMGVVYRARQISLNRPVALKMILDGALTSPAAITRFQIEAEAAAQLNHSHIVPIYETGVLRGRHFFSMKLLEGGNLKEHLAGYVLPAGISAADARKRQRKIAQLLATIADAVHHAHQRGILHRDLKPANILLDAERNPYVADFGIAKLMTDESDLTCAGAHMGTPAYMAPEQAAGDAQITMAVDVYGLGAILYHLLTGRPPFEGAGAVETMLQAVGKEATPPKKINPLVHRELSIICMKCLEKDPAHRYPSAQALSQDLKCWLNGEVISASPATRMEHLYRWCRRNPALTGLIVTVIVLLVAIATISTTAAFRIDRERQAAVQAHAESTEKLWANYLTQARAQYWSGKPGRRFDGLAAISNAVAIRPSFDLRNAAIACLSADDIREVPGAPETDRRDERLLIDTARSRYAIGEPDGAIHIRRLDNHEELLRLPAMGTGVLWLGSFSADGKYLSVTYQNEEFGVWDLASQVPAVQLTNISYANVSPDFSMIAYANSDRELFVAPIRDVLSKEKTPLSVLPIDKGSIFWGPGNGRLAVTYGTNIWVFDAKRACLERHFELANWIFDFRWHPDGTRFAIATGAQTAEMFDTRTGARLMTFAGHQGAVTGVDFNQTGTILASDSWDGKLHLWDVATGKEMANIPTGCERIDFFPDGRHLAVYGDSQSYVGCFELGLNEVTSCLPDSWPVSRRQGDQSLLFSRSGEWLATSEDNTLTLRNPLTLAPLTSLTNMPTASIEECGPELFSWGPIGLFLISLSHEAGVIKMHGPELFRPKIPASLRPVVPGDLWKPFAAGDDPDKSTVSVDGKTLALTYDEHCYIFNMAKHELQAITGRQTQMKCCAVDPGGKWIATSGWNVTNAVIWDAATGAELRQLPTGFSPTVLASPDGRLLFSGTGQEYCAWRTSDWTVAYRITRPGRDGLPGEMAISGNGKIAAFTDSRSNIQLISPGTGEILAIIEPTPELEINRLALNFDGTELAVNRMGAATQVWHLQAIRQQLAAMKLDW